METDDTLIHTHDILFSPDFPGPIWTLHSGQTTPEPHQRSSLKSLRKDAGILWWRIGQVEHKHFHEPSIANALRQSEALYQAERARWEATDGD